MAFPLRVPVILEKPATPRKARGQRSAANGLPATAAAAAMAALLLLWSLNATGRPPSLRWDPSPACLETIGACNAVPGLPSDVVCALLAAARSAAPPSPAAPSPIPRLLHQSWKTSAIPVGFRAWAATWQRHHPAWERRLWTDAANRALVAAHYPWLLPAYDAMPAPIFRADTARYLYLHRHGGVYADLDTVCLRPLEELLAGAVGEARPGAAAASRGGIEGPGWNGSGGGGGGRRVAVLARMSADEGFEHNVPNAWMASAPGHPFWLFVAGVIEARARRGPAHRLWELVRPARPEYETGPVILKQALDTWQCVLGGRGRGDGAGVHVLPPGRVFVGDWHNDTALSEFHGLCGGDEVLGEQGRRRCLAAYPHAHVLTYWTRTWYG